MAMVLCAGIAPAYAGDYQPNAGATFNLPRSTADKEFRVERTITSAIKHAKKGSLIRISLFSFDRKPVAQALIDAKKRGVHVQILLNDHQVTGAQRMLHRGARQEPVEQELLLRVHQRVPLQGREQPHQVLPVLPHRQGA